MDEYLLIEQLKTTWPVSSWGGTRVLLAVSGGADSVALLRAMLELSSQQTCSRPLIDVAHFNHGWRGAESDGDEAFVRELCQGLGVRAIVGHMPIEAVQKTEENARRARYDFLTRKAYDCGARYVVTAHTASDRVETLLHNLFRGTGLAGAAAPQLTRDLDKDLVLVRPLISCSRELVINYLSALGQTFREDTSNLDLTYRRNYIRHALLPQLRKQYGAQLDAHLLSFSELAEESVESLRKLSSDYLCEASEVLESSATQIAKEQIQLPTLNRFGAPWPVVREALMHLWEERGWPLGDMSRVHWEMLRSVFSGEVDHWNLPGRLVAKVVQNCVEIARIDSPGGSEDARRKLSGIQQT